MTVASVAGRYSACDSYADALGDLAQNQTTIYYGQRVYDELVQKGFFTKEVCSCHHLLTSFLAALRFPKRTSAEISVRVVWVLVAGAGAAGGCEVARGDQLGVSARLQGVCEHHTALLTFGSCLG